MSRKVDRVLRIIGFFTIVVIASRLFLPYLITRYVNKVLQELPGYNASVGGVKVQLLRGGYSIDSLRIYKTGGNKGYPFIQVKSLDFSLHWKSLLRGKFIAEAHFINPEVNLTAGEKNEVSTQTQWGAETNWVLPIRKLFPLQLNRLFVKDASFAYNDFTTTPYVNVFFENIYLDAQNLDSTPTERELMPSRILLQAKSIGNGSFSASMKINVSKQIPDLDLDLKFENIDMRALRDFFSAYANVDIQKGKFNLYSEVVVLNGKIDGYVKPLLSDMTLLRDYQNNKHKMGALKSGVTLTGKELKNEIPTRFPIKGHISQLRTRFCPGLWNIFRNACVEALEKNTHETISIAAHRKRQGKIAGTEISRLEGEVAVSDLHK